jgi:DNA-binding SARP family transcriptional activator
MEIALLGPLSAHLHGRPVLPNAAKPRQIFALLALNIGRNVGVPTLIDELWGDRPPNGCTTTLQTYIHQLRSMLETALADEPGRSAKEILTTQHNGYRLEEQASELDVSEFEQLTKSGRAAFDAEDDHAASMLLDQALALWQGKALADLPVGNVLKPEVTSLEYARLAALERRIEADLRLGRHADLLGDLGILVAQNPMNESFCAQLMTALYRSGHTTRALAEFQRLRSILVDESGIEPSPRLQRLQAAVLVGDSTLEWTAATDIAISPRSDTPSQARIGQKTHQARQG